jgi:hypothetical protein
MPLNLVPETEKGPFAQNFADLKPWRPALRPAPTANPQFISICGAEATGKPVLPISISER